MKKTDVAIIGGSAVGLTAALTLKRRNPEKEVVIIRDVKNAVVPCGIPYIYGTMKDVKKDIIPDQGFLDMGIKIMSLEVEKINRDKKILTFVDGTTLSYDKLIFGTGSKPFVPPMTGAGLENVFTIIKDPEHLQKLQAALQSVKNVVVIGGGFIGVEMAEQIAKMAGAVRQDNECTAVDCGSSVNITIIEMLPHCLMAACEEEFCVEVENELKRLGINVMTNAQVEAIKGSRKVESVKLADGRVLPADLVLMGIGVLPNIELAEKCGLETDSRLGVIVNEYMQTSDPDIYAAGDCASKFSMITGKPSGIRVASVACGEALIAASNIYKPKRKNSGALGAFATLVGTRGITAAGLTTKAAADEGIEVVTGEAVAPNRHPGNLPGCIPDMKAKLLFRKDNGKIVGGHIMGGEASADMLNIVSVAIQKGSTAEELATMQYATHPLLTASPVFYHIQLAAENAAVKLAQN